MLFLTLQLQIHFLFANGKYRICNIVVFCTLFFVLFPKNMFTDQFHFIHFWIALFSCNISRKTRCCKIFANYDKPCKNGHHFTLFCFPWLQDFQKLMRTLARIISHLQWIEPSTTSIFFPYTRNYPTPSPAFDLPYSYNKYINRLPAKLLSFLFT